MQSENIKEYESIRIEMLNLKDCITKYVGYVLAGSGAMIYGIARVERSISETINSPEVAVITSGFSMLISLVLLLLFYKFNSHNRFAGFCKLLNHERHEPLEISDHGKPKEKKQNNPPEDRVKTNAIFSWEVTVGDLRWLESTPQDLGSIINKVVIAEPGRKELKTKIQERVQYGKKPPIDAYGKIKGMGVLLRTLFLRKVRTDSWGFPPLVVCIFLVLSFGFLIASYVILYRIGVRGISSGLLVFEGLVTVFQICLWLHVCGRLYSLMNGSTTVYSFYWKFMPLRALFLNKQGIKPGYISTEDYVFSQVVK